MKPARYFCRRQGSSCDTDFARDSPIWNISLTGPNDGFTLRKYAEDIQTELEKIPGVREINISGGDVHSLKCRMTRTACSSSASL